MDKKTLKQIEVVLDKKLDEKLEPINRKLDEHTKKLDEHSSKLDALTLDMIQVQKKTDILPDLHSYIKDTADKVKEIEEKVEVLESSTP